MSIENQPSKKKRNKPLIFALIGAGALVASIGGVFATNSITINSDNVIEFGQGLAATSTCDADLTTELTQEYNATSTPAQFDAKTIVIKNIKDFACDGKTLHVSLLGASGVVCGVDGTDDSSANADAFLIADDGDSSDDNLTKTVTIASGCDASTVTNVAITTS